MIETLGCGYEIKNKAEFIILANHWKETKNVRTGVTTVNIDTDEAEIEMIVTPKMEGVEDE